MSCASADFAAELASRLKVSLMAMTVSSPSSRGRLLSLQSGPPRSQVINEEVNEPLATASERVGVKA